MRIDKTNPLDLYAAADFAASKARSAKSSDVAATDKTDPAGQTQSLVLQALSAHEFRPEAVEEAKRMLDSGELDTPENVMRAAEKLVDMGI